MTDNDYIAEYIKERHSDILGVNFAVWKLQKKLSEAAESLVQIFQSEEFKQALQDKAESEEHDK